MKTKLLFVDDDPNLIRGLKRMLFSKRDVWDCYFAENGFDALKIMEEQNIACVISDMRMPGMDGAQLLSFIKKRFPQAIRIILSGHSDKEMSLRSTQVAHQFLAKPCQSEVLLETIEKILHLQSQLNSEKLKNIVTGIGELPRIPDLFMQLEQALMSESVSVQKIASIISQDISMTTKILQLVNTAFFGLPTNITNPVQAVNYLGINIIKSLVLYIKLYDGINATPDIKHFINNVWQHSIIVANFARELVKGKLDKKDEEDDVYVAGLLHDVGRLILLSLPEYYNSVTKMKERSGVNSYEAETYLYGSTHCEVGAYLFRLWGLHDNVIFPVLLHHDYKFTDYSINPESAVYIANFLSHVKEISIDDIKEKNKNYADFSWFKEFRKNGDE